MKTLTDIRKRSEDIQSRLADIFDDLQNSEDQQAKALEYAEEIAKLLYEDKVLQYNLRHHEMVTVQLLGAKCSGPH
jgi:hypothetical protein